MNLNELLFMVPDLISLFLPGFIFVSIYEWIERKTTKEFSKLVISVILSYIIKSFYSLIHHFCFNVYFSESTKNLIYIITGFVLPFVTVRLKRREWVKTILRKTAYKAFNDNIFKDVIDYEHPTILCIYMKTSDNLIFGHFSYIEENGPDSYLALVNYLYKSPSGDVIENSVGSDNSLLMLSLKDIEKIEVLYSEGSKVWEHFRTR